MGGLYQPLLSLLFWTLFIHPSPLFSAPWLLSSLGLSHRSLIYLAGYLLLPLLRKNTEPAYKNTQNNRWRKWPRKATEMTQPAMRGTHRNVNYMLISFYKWAAHLGPRALGAIREKLIRQKVHIYWWVRRRDQRKVSDHSSHLLGTWARDWVKLRNLRIWEQVSNFPKTKQV